jgi:GNAT superfamily N-acetyltransferase
MRDRHDVELLARCFEHNGSPRDMHALEWQYLDNPSGKLWTDFAITKAASRPDTVAAIYATLPIRVRLGETSRLALQSLDTLTDREYRGRGLFARLAAETFERARTDGVAFVYGFPNKFSAPGFFGKLGWHSLDPLPFLIRPLRLRYVATRLKLGRFAKVVPDIALATSAAPPPGAVEVHRFDARFSRLWSAFARNVGVAVERDDTYLNWRLVDKPNQSYQRFAIFEGGEAVAFVAFTWQDKHGGRIGTIMELMFAPGRAPLGRSLLSFGTSWLAREGADAVMAWCLPGSPNFASFVALGFMPLPERLKPVELHFGARAFDPRVASVVSDRARWYVSYLDSDTT